MNAGEALECLVDMPLMVSAGKECNAPFMLGYRENDPTIVRDQEGYLHGNIFLIPIDGQKVNVQTGPFLASDYRLGLVSIGGDSGSVLKLRNPSTRQAYEVRVCGDVPERTDIQTITLNQHDLIRARGCRGKSVYDLFAEGLNTQYAK